MEKRATAFALACVVSACVTSACAAGPGARPATLAPAPAVAGTATSYDTTYYVTNRARRDGRATRTATDSLEFGLVVSRVTEHAGRGSSGPYLESINSQAVDSARFSRAEFLSRLHSEDVAAAARGEGTVVYVHGFATSLGRAIAQGTEVAHRGSFRGPFIVFAWPAHTALATWPSRTSLLSRAYRQDSVSASESMGAFRAAITDVRAAARGSALTIVGHSLGAQLVTEALYEHSALRDSLDATPMRALVLFAPDISAARYRDTLAAALAPVAARQVVYASDGDWLLGISRLVNHAPRVGRLGPARPLAAQGVEVVDVSHGLRVDGAIRKFFEPHHAMRSASSALYDFFGVVRGLPAECRDAEGVAEREADGTWRLTNATIPSVEPAPAAACAER